MSQSALLWLILRPRTAYPLALQQRSRCEACAVLQEAIASYEKCLELAPRSRNAGQNRLLALNYTHAGEDAYVCKAHAEWGDELQAATQALPDLGQEAIDWDPERCLTVGYVSPDLFTHSVSYFAEAPLTHHDTSRSVPVS